MRAGFSPKAIVEWMNNRLSRMRARLAWKGVADVIRIVVKMNKINRMIEREGELKAEKKKI